MSAGGKVGFLVRRSWQFRNRLGLDGFDGAPVLIHLYSDLLSDRNVFEKFRFHNLKKHRFAGRSFQHAAPGCKVQPLDHAGDRQFFLRGGRTGALPHGKTGRFNHSCNKY